jgi:hypothetical protein
MLVMYVDGNLEFANGFDNPDKDYKKFKRYLSSIPNLNYLYDNIVVLNDVAFIGVNGWWNFDFADPRDQQQIIDWYTQSGICPRDTDKILETARNDVTYLLNSIKKLQHNHNVKSIVVCTHTVPRLDLIEHDIALNQSLQIHVMGNQWLNQIKQIDVTKKIHTWVFGHYHSPVDRILDQIRYVNNSRGDQHSILLPYYPKKIFID